jgi:hypothetical protein
LAPSKRCQAKIAVPLGAMATAGALKPSMVAPASVCTGAKVPSAARARACTW